MTALITRLSKLDAPDREVDAVMARKNNFFGKFTRKDEDECWEWHGTKKKSGSAFYGRFYISKTKHIVAHRASYMIAHEVHPGEMNVCHSCDNTLCVNPRHLWLGTAADNNRDRDEKGRAAPTPESFKYHGKTFGERHGSHKLTEQDVVEIRQRYKAGERMKALAKEKGVHVATIHRAIQGATWSHIDKSIALLRAKEASK